MKILLVEDEENIARGLRFNLEAEGFSVEHAPDGRSALGLTSENAFDAIVMDVMLPDIDGFEVTRRIRARSDHTPILMLTARGRPEDVLAGFEAGTDDYLPKPFDLKIFVARLKGLLRRRNWSGTGRSAASEQTLFEINGRTVDLENLELRHGDSVAHITLMEAKLLRYMIENKGRPVSRKTILQEVWGLQEDTDTRAIDNFIVRLRKYLEDKPNDPKIVRTVRGIGYKFVDPASEK